ncbi:DUF3572 domain-containing protein [Wenxinia marina]|uniref:DUF3572 domain-containing protein n=1 Tax=Wenxinia marina DSM 24838 TaxID=1123501 RepID=A0A0D0Q5E3_9RHOB|nr:DUF3572 domain-containing protein [Wenxinia marina]KIQ69694.1 hypothetical protein Wenmar_02058 [Wenxinia marina DSM 24838]GGL60460.1 hypothetical protein GCM10011392_13650 [Wenxinia marina]
MTRDEAETVALTVLGWLAGEEEIMPVFLGASGLDRETLAARATDPDLLVSVLEFVTMDDRWVLSCAGATGLKPEAPMQAHAILSGAARTHWT